jgi:uncharacterized protein (TIGR02271 family)
MRTVIGLYEDVNTAQQVVQELVDSGFERDNISIVAQNSTTTTETGEMAYADSDDVSAAEGAGVGALGGGVLGLLAGLGALAIPGIGPVVAAGPLIGALTGAVAGGVTGGLTAGLIDSGIPEEEAGYYAEGVRRGGTLVSVQAADERASDAAAIMNRYGAVDIDERVSQWRESGWTGFDANAEPYDADTLRTERERYSSRRTDMTDRDTMTREGETTIPIVEEELQIGKRQVQGGGVRIHSHVTERPVEEQVTLREERVTVDRRPVDRAVTDADINDMRDRDIEVTATSEQAVVNKQARVVEEVVVNKDVNERTETISDTVRRTDVDVENLGTQTTGSTMATDTDWNRYDADFRSNWHTTYGSRGGTYDDYMPAYRSGFTYANDPRYANREWNDVEMDLRRDWDTRGEGTWEEVKDAVRYGWDRVRGRR